MLELERPLVVTDVETTGVHPQVDRIIQIGIVKLFPPDGQRRTEWETLVNPTIPIPPESTECHGITDEMVKDAPTFKDLASRLAGGLAGCDLAGFNVRFDKQMLTEEFTRVGGRAVMHGMRVVDAFRIFIQRERRDLAAAVEYYLGRKTEKAHSALPDARDALDVLIAQLTKYPDLPRTVEELHKVYFESPAIGFLDVDQKLAWRYGEATINFGKYATVPLKNLDRGYIDWVLRGDFSPTVKAILRECLEGRYPRRTS